MKTTLNTHSRRKEKNEGMGMDKKIDLPVTGMTCASCAAAVENGLRGIDGVKSAAVNFASERPRWKWKSP